MKKEKNNSKILLKLTGLTAVGSVLFMADKIQKIHKRINSAVSTQVLSVDRYQPSYICIEDPIIQEQIEAGNSITKERLKLTRIHRWLNDKIEESFIFRNWYSYKKNQAWRFLRLAKDDNRSYRIRAVRSLSALKDLSDSDYQQLAQSCDLRTAVGLARSTKNEKFFLDPPYYKLKPDRNAIIRHFHDFFLALTVEAKHPCLQYFISKLFIDVPEGDYIVFDDDLVTKINQNVYIPMCVEALLHHSWIGQNARNIVTLGGLPLLVEVYKYLQQEDPNNVECFIMLSRLMSNISVHEDCMPDFFASGWIKLLVLLAQHEDIRVSAPAERALINFDLDDPLYGGNIKYFRRIYPLYPTRRIKFQPKLDVVFIHGLLGGVFITWRQRISGNPSPKSPLELLEKPRFHFLQGIFSSYNEGRRFTPRNSLENDFFLDVRELDVDMSTNIAKDYNIVLSDLPVDANVTNSEPFFW